MSAPVDHPPPWAWSDPHGRETLLSDANGNVVLAYGNDSTIVVASPYVREVVRAAPQMAALLSRAATAILDGDDPCFACGQSETGKGFHTPDCELISLLAFIDEARRG